MTSPIEARLADEVDRLRRDGRLLPLRSADDGALPRLRVDGRWVLVLCSNDYLGLANDGEVKAAAASALSKHGCGAAAGRTIAGTTELHVRLEAALAAFSGFEAALLFTSAYTANVGLLTTVLRDGDIVFSDQLNHASIIDGCRYSPAASRVYPHADVAALEQMLGDAPTDAPKLIVTDGVFSMEGDIAPLPRLVELKKRFGAMLVVDDAHAIGVLGERGAGSIEFCGVEGEVDIQVGTLGKALGGALGGYVAGSRAVIDALSHRTRTFIFTNPVPAPLAAASLAALDTMQRRPELRETLWANARRLRSGLAERGFRLIDGETPIVPVLVGDDALAIEFSRRLFERGLLVQAFAYPVVPAGHARLRCIASAAHRREDIEEAIDAIVSVGRELGLVA